MNLVQHALILFDRPLAAPRHLELPQQRRQRRAQLVRGIARESLLPLEFLVQPVEQPVERPRQKIQLVARSRNRQPLIAVGHRHRARRLRHPRHRQQSALAKPPPHHRRQQPETNRKRQQHQRHIPSAASIGASDATVASTSDARLFAQPARRPIRAAA